MKNNPKLNSFLDIGIKRFAERGIDGIKIDEICDEVGVAKSSFYHYFGNKKGFIDQLFDYWFEITHGETSESVKHIDNPRERFLALKKIIDKNEEVEYCYLQMKLFALQNEKAREIVEKAKKKRYDVLYEIFKKADQSDEDADYNTRKMILLYYGRVALTHGYTGSTDDIDIANEHFLEFLGLSNK